MHKLAALLAWLSAAVALAQPGPAAAPPPPIAYKTVAEALAALEARDGVDAVVTHADGWTTVNEPAASAQWSFTPKDHYAYPAAVRRIVLRAPGGGVSIDTQSLCEAPKEQCAKLLAEFATMNERIVQAVKARGGGPGRPN